MMKMPGNTSARIGFSSDSRKKLGFSVYLNGSRGNEYDSRNINTGVDISYKPTNYLVVTLSPAISKSFSELQYVSQMEYSSTGGNLLSRPESIMITNSSQTLWQIIIMTGSGHTLKNRSVFQTISIILMRILMEKLITPLKREILMFRNFCQTLLSGGNTALVHPFILYGARQGAVIITRETLICSTTWKTCLTPATTNLIMFFLLNSVTGSA